MLHYSTTPLPMLSAESALAPLQEYLFLESKVKIIASKAQELLSRKTWTWNANLYSEGNPIIQPTPDPRSNSYFFPSWTLQSKCPNSISVPLPPKPILCTPPEEIQKNEAWRQKEREKKEDRSNMNKPTTVKVIVNKSQHHKTVKIMQTASS